MADNVTSEAVVSSGATFAADDIGTVYYPRNKITLGADGVNDGDVSSANPMPVTGTITAVTSITNAVAVTDNSGSLTVDDGGSTLSIDDGTGSITVDNGGTFAVQSTLQAGTAYAGKVRLTDGTTDAEVVPLTGYNAQAVAIVDGSGNQITSFGGGTQYTEGDTDTTITGTAVMFESNTGTSALSVVSNSTPLPVSDAGGSITVDNGGTFAVQVSSALPAGTNAIGKLAANSGVDIGDVDVTSVVPGTGATSLGKAAGSAVGGTDTGVACLGKNASGNYMVVRTNDSGHLIITEASPLTSLVVYGESSHDGALVGGATMPVLIGGVASAAAPTSVNADGDAVQAWFLRNGAQTTQPTYSGVLAVAGNGASGTGVQRVTIANDSTGVLATVSTVTTVSTLTGGGVAHDGADSGNPVKVGARAAATLSDDTMVANGDRTDAVSDLDGALLMRSQYPLGDIISERVSNTDGASTAFTNFGATASTRSVITAVVIHNSSATDGYVDFRDGTAGSVLYTVPIPAGGGAILPAGATPYFRTSANTALAFDVSAALTTVYISVTGFKSKV